MKAAPHRPAAAPGDLARLVETELRLEASLADVRAEARRLVADARQAADRRAGAAAAATVEARARFAAELAVERDRELAAIAAAAARDAARYEGIAKDRVEALARLVVTLIVGEGA